MLLLQWCRHGVCWEWILSKFWVWCNVLGKSPCGVSHVPAIKEKPLQTDFVYLFVCLFVLMTPANTGNLESSVNRTTANQEEDQAGGERGGKVHRKK